MGDCSVGWVVWHIYTQTVRVEPGGHIGATVEFDARCRRG